MNAMNSAYAKASSHLKRYNIVIYFIAVVIVYTIVLYFTKNGQQPLCTNIKTFSNTTRDGEWVTVVSDFVHVYSAYFDDRESPATIKIMGTGVHRPAVKSYGLYCQIWMRDSQRNWMHIVEAKQSLLPVRMGRRYEGIIFMCDPPETESKDSVPLYVSLSTAPCNQPTWALAVQQRITPFIPQYNFTMCLSPIYNDFSNVGEVLGYMEMNRILGADRFIMYNLSIGSALSPLLDSYKEDGILEVLDWKIPMKHFHGPVPDIHYLGQLIAFNDCLYRARRNSRYVVFTDMDEIISPLQHDNWLDLLSQITHVSESNLSAFVFRNAFFPKSWESDPTFKKNVINRKYRFLTMTLTKRETSTWEHIHSKLIGHPNGIKVMAIHTTHTLADGYKDLVVPEEQGLLFHYRSNGHGRLYSLLSKLRPLDQRYLVEKRMFDFAKTFFSNTKKRLNKIGISVDDLSPSLAQARNTSNIRHYMKELNFMLQSHPWAQSILFE